MLKSKRKLKKKKKIIRGGFWEIYLKKRKRFKGTNKKERKMLKKKVDFKKRLNGKKFLIMYKKKNFGVGDISTFKVMAYLGISKNFFWRRVKEREVALLDSLMESDLSLVKGGDLKSRTRKSIRILKEIKSYRGIRHKLRLPVRGQRSKTNSRTVRKR